MSDSPVEDQKRQWIKLYIRISPDENKILQEYSAKTYRNYPDIIRGLIRSLKRRL